MNYQLTGLLCEKIRAVPFQINDLDDKDMNDLAALRLYFPMSAKANRTRLWHHLGAPNLAHHLLTYARRVGLTQAILHHVDAGYLAGGRLSHHYPDCSSMNHPQCLELIDTETNLRKFMNSHEHELHKVHAVLFKVELMSAPSLKPAPAAS